MGKTNIQWCDYTFNHVRGCTKVSAGCAHCYAETMSGRNPRTLGVWGPNGTRIVAAEAAWREPLKWNRAYDKALRFFHERPYTLKPERPRVFCASLADLFEDWQGKMDAANGEQLWFASSGSTFWWTTKPGGRVLDMAAVRRRLFETINDTPHLDWLLLTKRPENFRRMLPDRWLDIHWPDNVWLGVSVEDQQRANERIPHLLSVPAKIRFLSVEPLLGPIDLTSLKLSPLCENEDMDGNKCGGQPLVNAFSRSERCDCTDEGAEPLSWHRLGWVIVGGESGRGARSCQIEWIRSIVTQCKAASVPVFVKQLGKAPTLNYYDDFREVWEHRLGYDWPAPIGWNSHDGQPMLDARIKLPLADPKGGDEAEWPEDLRIREFPVAS